MADLKEVNQRTVEVYNPHNAGRLATMGHRDVSLSTGGKVVHMRKVRGARLAAIVVALSGMVGLGTSVAHADVPNVTRDSTFSFASYTCSTSTTVQTGAVTAGDIILIGVGQKGSALGSGAVTDNQSNGYLEDMSHTFGGPLTQRGIAVYDTKVATTSSTGVTITVACSVAEIAGSGEILTPTGTTFWPEIHTLNTSWDNATSASFTDTTATTEANDLVFAFAYTRESRSLVTSGTNAYHDNGYKHTNTSGTADSVDNIGSTYVTWPASSYPTVAFSTGSTTSWGAFMALKVHFN